MGFGIIFTGYLFTIFDLLFIVHEGLLVFFCKLLCVIGYTVLLIGLRKFAVYSRYAKYALYGTVLLDAAMIFDAVVQGLWGSGVMDEATMAGIRTYSYTVNAVLFAFAQVMLMFAIFDIGRETECDKVKKNGIRSVAATAAFCLINITATIIKFGSIFDIIHYSLFLIVTAINAVTLYSAYRYICLDTELEAERAEMLKDITFKKGKK